VPVICGAAFKNKGIQALLDAVVDYLPAPTDIPPIKGHRSRGICRITTRRMPSGPRLTTRHLPRWRSRS